MRNESRIAGDGVVETDHFRYGNHRWLVGLDAHSNLDGDVECEIDQLSGVSQRSIVGLATNFVDHAEVGAPSSHVDENESRIDQRNIAFLYHDVDPALIYTIQKQWRLRQAWHRAEKSLTLQAKALCRGLAEAGDKKEAETIYTAALGEGEHAASVDALAAMLPLLDGRKIIETKRKAIEKELAKLALRLHVAPFIADTRGVGIMSLAAVVGEAGDLGRYDNPAKLWKRMGLAVMSDGTRQRRVAGEEAFTHGYAPKRRSVMWNIGACIVKAGGPLKTIYDERKVYELTRVETKGHAHNRAQRYVEKRFLLLLWREWRRQAGARLAPIESVSAANFCEVA